MKTTSMEQSCNSDAPKEGLTTDACLYSKASDLLRDRPAVITLFITLAVLTLFHLRYLPTKLAHYTDPVIYLSGAESLAKGEGYRFAAHAGSPRIGCQPPLQAAYLSLFWRLHPQFPQNVWLLYAGLVLCILATFILFYFLCCKNGLPPLMAGLTILAWGLSLQWNTLLYGLMSDILFGLLGLILATYWLGTNAASASRRWFVTGILVALMYLSRTAAVAVMGVLGLVVAFRGWKTRKFGPLVAYLIPIVPTVFLWKFWTGGTPGYADYMRFRIAEEGSWQKVFEYNLSSAMDYLSGLGFVQCLFGSFVNLSAHPGVSNTTLSPILTALTLVFCWAFTGFWLVGCWRAKMANERVLALVVAAYLVHLCLYPANLSERCLYAILPFVVIWAWKGFSALPWKVLEIRLVRYGLLLSLGLIIVGNAVDSVRGARFLDSSGHQKELNEVGSWLRANSPPETVVAATLSEPLMHFYHASGRKVVENYFQAKPWFSVAAHSTNNAVKADYVLLYWYSTLSTNDLSCELQLAKASSQGRFRLYRVISDSRAGTKPAFAAAGLEETKTPQDRLKTAP